jgi:copper(I)-binding protein
LLSLAGLCATAAFAADIEVANPWVRGTVAAQKATGAFMQLSSKGGVSLVGAPARPPTSSNCTRW